MSSSLSDLCAIDYSGRSVVLQPMRHRRSSASLSGLSTHLIALAGYHKRSLRICEKYRLSTNKWDGLPPLSIARQWPGSILLKSKRAFCFFGIQEISRLNCIESVEIETEPKWRILPINHKIEKTYQVVAVQFKKSIAGFGGNSRKANSMYILSEEGEREQDVSEDRVIPAKMC